MQGKSKEIQTPPAGAYRFGAFDLHPSERQLLRRGKRVPLAPKAFDALLLLVRNAERLVRKEDLMRALWPDTFVEEANLTNLVVALRKTLGKTAIETVAKYGYRFRSPVLGEPGIDPETYATFARARQLMVVRSEESAATARDLFLLCVARDPSFAAAWAWLGRCYRFLEKFGVEPSRNVDLAHAAFGRALAIDPDLAPAHQFFTQLQADMGHAQDAMVRLSRRIATRGGDAESFAGLVQVLRFCGLLAESVAAHDRAQAFDPTVPTSVAHTHFLRGDFQAALDTYGAFKVYLDVAAWAGLGDTERATLLLRQRLAAPAHAPLSFALMGSLLAALEGRRDEALRIIETTPIVREPESVFYLARHCAMLDATADALALLARARVEGFVSPATLEQDPAFASLREQPAFHRELAQAKDLAREARRAYAAAGLA